MKYPLLLLLSAGLFQMSAAQDLKIKRIEVDAEKMYIIYDLQDTTRGRSYTVNLYSSRDNFINPVQKIKGDWGLEVYPGTNRRIEWSVKEEVGATFEGKVAVELRAKVYIPFIRLEDLSKLKKIKRGKPTAITWSGGRPQNILNFELYRGEQKVHTIPNVANVGSHEILLPVDTKPGSGYKFKVTDTRNKDEVVFSTPFTVARKVPLLVKIVPVVAVGVGVYFLLDKEKNNDIEGFPGPPTSSN